MISDISPIQGVEDLLPLASDSALARAHREAVAVSVERLAAVFPAEMGFADQGKRQEKPVLGTLQSESLIAALEPWSLVETGTRQWLRADDEAPMGMALEAAGRSDAVDDLLGSPLGHDPLPGRSVGRMAAALDDGYMLAVHGAGDANAELQLVLEDLERALRVAVVSTLLVGVRTTLGAMPAPSSYDRLFLQLGGRRHLAVTHGAEQRGHMTLTPGRVVFVPRGWVARHEPADSDTIHLEFVLSEPVADGDNAQVAEQTSATSNDAAREAGEGDADGVSVDPHELIEVPAEFVAVWPAWLGARGTAELTASTHALVHDAWPSVDVRVCVPGGIFHVGDPSAHRYAAGGFEFTIEEAAIPEVASLVSAVPLPGGDFSPAVLEGLLRAGILAVTSR